MDVTLIALTTLHDTEHFENKTAALHEQDENNIALNKSNYYDLSASKVPVGSLYTIMVIYMFLPIARKDIAVSFGLFVSVVSVTLTTTCNVSFEIIYLIMYHDLLTECVYVFLAGPGSEVH